MPDSSVYVYIHMIWATFERNPLIDPAWEGKVYASINDKCSELRCNPLAIGGIDDHVHVLVRLHATVSVAQLAKNVKGASSHLITHTLQPGGNFKWQSGYGALSVSLNLVDRVTRYIENQKHHHGRDALWPSFEDANLMTD